MRNLIRSLIKIFSPLLGLVGLGVAARTFETFYFKGDMERALYNAAIGWLILYASYRGGMYLLAEPAAPGTTIPAPQQARVRDIPATPWDSVIRSLFFSGAGQFHNGQTLKGILLFPVSAAFYLLCLFFVMSFADVDRRSPFPYDSLLFYMKVLGVLWFCGIVDAYIVSARMIRAEQEINHKQK